MSDENKIYTAEVIEESAIPGGDTSDAVASDHGSSSTETYSQTTIDEISLPTPKIATELISSKLNTKTRKILGDFSFTPTGSIQIGDYKNGDYGDIRISPNGIVARNTNGDTTFALDGDSGDAVFAGTIQAGTLISGAVAVGDGNILIDGATRRMLFYDANGIPNIVIGLVS